MNSDTTGTTQEDAAQRVEDLLGEIFDIIGATAKDLPFKEGDAFVRDMMETLKGPLTQVRLVRARRIADRRAAGTTPANIAKELGVSSQIVYEQLRLAGRSDCSYARQQK